MMTWILRMFETHRRVERELDAVRYELQFWRLRAEELQSRVDSAKDSHIKDLKKVADSESRRMTGRNIFSSAGQGNPEDFGRVIPRDNGALSRRQQVLEASRSFAQNFVDHYTKKPDQ